MKFNLKLIHKGLILVSVPLLFEIIFVLLLFGMLQRAELERAKAEHARALVAEAGELLRDLYNIGVAVIAYRMLRTQEYSEHYDVYVKRVKTHEEILKQTATGNATEMEMIDELSAEADRCLTLFHDAKQIIDEGGQEFSMRPYHNVQKEGTAAMRQIVSQVQQVTAFEQAQSYAPHAERARRAVNYALAGGLVLNVLVAVSLALFFNRGTSQRLGLLMDNTHLLASGEPLHSPIGGGDEIAHLDRVFHDMAHSLGEAARLKQEFVAMITHDLRTPLTSVRGSLALLSSGPGTLPKPVSDELKSAEANVTRVIRLINELLDVEKMEAGKMEMEMDVVPAAYVIETATAAVRGLADELNVHLRVPSTDAHVFADGDRLAQVMVNLLSNAIKFSPKDSTVTVEVSETPTYVEFRVLDQGPGIPKAYEANLFERYKQVKGVKGAGQQGTGLGLSISKLIVEQHDGTIGFTSKPGSGSTFWFRIPAKIPVNA
jgi:signal transduction histidine kinase